MTLSLTTRPYTARTEDVPAGAPTDAVLCCQTVLEALRKARRLAPETLLSLRTR